MNKPLARGFTISSHSILMKQDPTSEVEIKSIIFGNGEAVFALEKDTEKAVDHSNWKN